jgi:hypothetical protein
MSIESIVARIEQGEIRDSAARFNPDFVSLNPGYACFVESLRLLMVEANYVKEGESVDVAAGRFLKEKYPDLDPVAQEALVLLISAFDQRQGTPVVKLSDVYLIKLLCETIFRDMIMPSVLRSKSHEGVKGVDSVEPG